MSWEQIPEIDLYSDGGAEPNPGKGGFGVIMVYKGAKKEFSQGYRLTTNNRMELSGVIYGLERLKTKSKVNVYTDSRYVVDGIEKGWAKKWKSKNWYRTRTQKAVNYDLWAKLLDLIAAQEAVRFNWIRGHVGHPENERCDELANFALNGDSLLVDTFYEETMNTETGEENTTTTLFGTETTAITAANPNLKITNAGDPCRKCGTAVIQRPTKKKELKPEQTYYFEYFFLCPKCKTAYMVEEAKRFL